MHKQIFVLNYVYFISKENGPGKAKMQHKPDPKTGNGFIIIVLGNISGSKP